eukprot:scaffold488851_cov138-Attheya_sp.AAC.1
MKVQFEQWSCSSWMDRWYELVVRQDGEEEIILILRTIFEKVGYNQTEGKAPTLDLRGIDYFLEQCRR